METENKDWKPEVGKTAWAMMGNGCQEVSVSKVGKETVWIGLNNGKDGRFCPLELLHPSPEAALASIKIYDLEGKEVVIPRAEQKYEIDVLASDGRLLSPFEKQFYDFCKQDPENVAKFGLALMGGGAAIGGKSDQREGGC